MRRRVPFQRGVESPRMVLRSRMVHRDAGEGEGGGIESARIRHLSQEMTSNYVTVGSFQIFRRTTDQCRGARGNLRVIRVPLSSRAILFIRPACRAPTVSFASRARAKSVPELHPCGRASPLRRYEARETSAATAVYAVFRGR